MSRARFCRLCESSRLPPFDLVLADPPYGKGLLEKTLIGLEGHSIFSPSAWLVFELSTADAVVERPGWSLIKDRKYGETRLLTYEKSGHISGNV